MTWIQPIILHSIDIKYEKYQDFIIALNIFDVVNEEFIQIITAMYQSSILGMEVLKS